MALFSKVNGRRVNSFRVSASSQMVRSTMANGMRGSQRVLVLKFGQTVVAMKATGIKVNR